MCSRLVFLFIFLFSNCNAFEQLIDFKVNQDFLIRNNKLQAVFSFGEAIDETSNVTSINKDTLIANMRERGVNDRWLGWFEGRFQSQQTIDFKKFAAVIFYPYELIEESPKQHIREMGYVIKTLIWYSSRFDPTSVGAKIISGLSPSCTYDIRSNNDLLEALDISLIANNGKFQEIARNYLNRQGNLGGLFNFLLERGSATQLLGFGSLLKTIGNKGDAFRAFTKGYEKGSVRAAIEQANLLLEEDFPKGSEAFSALGVYGTWKRAQCYRYGKQIESDLVTANQLYLSILGQDYSRFPEIVYDAGEFVEQYAFSQNNKEAFRKSILVAMHHFERAGELHLGSGYIKVAELINQSLKKYPDLAVDPSFSDATLQDILKRAAIEGQYQKSLYFIDKIGGNRTLIMIPGSIEFFGNIAVIDKVFGE